MSDNGPSTEPCLALRDVAVRRGDHFSLTVPSLEFERGGIHAIVGPNGSGKTTLLHVLDLLEAPNAGQVLFDGEAVSPSSAEAVPMRRRMALVMQEPYLFRGTVADNLAYGLKLRGLPTDAIATRVLEWLERMRLRGFESRKAAKLSGGESKRVAIARALALDAELLLLDEPTANVDRAHVRLVEEQVLQANSQRGATVILTTHDLDQARRLTPSITSLVAGRTAPVPPDNVFKCEVAREGDGMVARLAPGVEISVAEREPSTAHVMIDPASIIVSLRPLDSSAHNCLPAHITRLTHDEHGVWLDADAGVPLHVAITQASCEAMELRPGAKVFLTFKASSVHVL